MSTCKINKKKDNGIYIYIYNIHKLYIYINIESEDDSDSIECVVHIYNNSTWNDFCSGVCVFMILI